MGESTPIRTAMGEAYLGDSKNFRAMFAAPQTFDLRLQNILSGFAQHTDGATADDLAMAANLRAIAKEIDSSVQSQRLTLIAELKALNSNLKFASSERSFPGIGPQRFPLANLESAGASSADISFSPTVNLLRHSEYVWTLAFEASFNPMVSVASASSISYQLPFTKAAAPLMHEMCSQYKAFKTAGGSTVATQRVPYGIQSPIPSRIVALYLSESAITPTDGVISFWSGTTNIIGDLPNIQFALTLNLDPAG